MCHVCRRTMLAGERYRTWRWGRRDRSVCAPHSASAGTSISPNDFIGFGATQRTLSQFSEVGWKLMESYR